MRQLAIALLVCALSLRAQRPDYGTKFLRTSDASEATWVKPFKRVFTSPSGVTCTAGQAGESRLYICASVQLWVCNGSAFVKSFDSAPGGGGGSSDLTAEAVIDIAPVPDGACVLDSTAVTVTGAALGGRPTIGVSFALPAGVTLTAKVIGPNSMKVEVCNWSGATFDPASATYYLGVTQ